MTCERWGGLGERHDKLHDSDVLPGLFAGKNAEAVSGQLGRRYRRGLSEWHPDFVLIGSDCIGSVCDLQSVTCDVWCGANWSRLVLRNRREATARMGWGALRQELALPAVTARAPPREHRPHGWGPSRHAIPCATRPCYRSGMCCARCRARPCRTSSSS